MEGTILDSIIKRKRIEVKDLELSKLDLIEHSFKPRSLLEKLRSTEEVAIISEFKRASPSKGNINLKLKPAEQARHYVKAGASAISVLTDEIGFKGTFSDLEKVRKAVDIPLLCKDFIIDKVQIDLARYSGADVILLIAAALSREELANLYAYASSQGLECLVEIHDEKDLENFNGTLHEFEMLLLKKRLDEFNGNRTLTAKSLNVSVRWIQLKLKELGENGN